MCDNDVHLVMIDSYKMSKNGFIVDFSKKKKWYNQVNDKAIVTVYKKVFTEKEEYHEKR